MFRKKILNYTIIIFLLITLFLVFFKIEYLFFNTNIDFNFDSLFSIKVFAQSIFDYFSEDQLLLYILYADYDQLQDMAKYYNLDTDKKKEELQKELLIHFNLEVKKISAGKKELLIIKSADIILMDNIKKIDANVIELFGNIYLIIGKKIFKADHIIFNSKDNQVFAEGNVVFIDDKNTYYADKISFNLNLQKGVFTGVRGQLDNYYIKTNKLYALSKDSFYAQITSISTCDLINPHYHIESDTIYYSNDYILSFDNSVYVGNSRIFWFPIYFSLERGAGYSGNFGMEYEKREGFKFYNTWHFKKNIFSLDYYENLGFYSIYNFNNSKNIKANFTIGLGNYLFYDSASDLWTTISPYDGKKDWTLRYGGNLSFSYPKLFNFLGLTLNLEYYSDTYLYSDVIKNKRLEKFEIQKFLKTYYPDIFPTTKDSLNQSLNLHFNLLNIPINVSSSLKLYSYINDQNYIYTPGYKNYYLFSIYPYNISSGKNLINFNNSLISLSNRFQISSLYYLQYKYNDSGENIFENSSLDSQNFRFTFSYPITLNIGNKIFRFNSVFNPGLNYISNYDVENNKLDQSASGYNFSLNNSFNINSGFFNLRLSLINRYVDYFYKNLDFNWVSSFLNLNANGALLSNIFKYSISTGVNLLNSQDKLVFDFKKENLNNLNFNFSFNPVNILSLRYSTSFKLSVYTSIDKFFNLKLFDSLSLSLNPDYFYIYKIKTKINDTIYYYNDKTSNFNKYLTNTFSLSFMLTDQFSLSLRVSSENRSLWVYNTFQEGFIDLFKSFNFFNEQDRISSYFNLKSLSLSFKRDLHKFTLFVGITGGFIIIDNTYNFKITYSFGISSLDFKDLEYEERNEQIY